MRKLLLALAGAATILSTGAFTDQSNAATLSRSAGLRAAIVHGGAVTKARLVCTHFWNGRYHRRVNCIRVHRHGHHHGYYR